MRAGTKVGTILKRRSWFKFRFRTPPPCSLRCMVPLPIASRQGGASGDRTSRVDARAGGVRAGGARAGVGFAFAVRSSRAGRGMGLAGARGAARAGGRVAQLADAGRARVRQDAGGCRMGAGAGSRNFARADRAGRGKPGRGGQGDGRGRKGLLACARTGETLVWRPTIGKLKFPSGAVGQAYSGASPDQLRGPQHHFAWADEIAKWQYPTTAGTICRWGCGWATGPARW